jgi:hypothetical protein
MVCRINDLPLTSLYQILTDRELREQCLARVTDPLILQTFARYEHVNQTQESASAFRRAFLLTFHDLTRLALGQPDCILDIRRLMDEGDRSSSIWAASPRVRRDAWSAHC